MASESEARAATPAPTPQEQKKEQAKRGRVNRKLWRLAPSSVAQALLPPPAPQDLAGEAGNLWRNKLFEKVPALKAIYDAERDKETCFTPFHGPPELPSIRSQRNRSTTALVC
jgi:hypothetical protein